MNPTLATAVSLPRRWPWHLPAHGINGIGVALGVLLVQLAAWALGGPAAAFVASGGAIFASLADTPNVPRRSWRRITLAGTVGLVASTLVTLLHGHEFALGGLVAALAFVAALMLAWGVRAGPISFVPMLAIVFTMAAPPLVGWRAQLHHVAWTAFGGVLYLGWALAVSHLLQPRYRALALAGVLEATAALLRSRSALLLQDRMRTEGEPPLQAWMARQVTLDERLQTARDLLFESADAPDAPRRIAVLLLAIDLRDTLLGSELDLELLGHDAPAERLRSQLAATIDTTAAALDRMALALQLGQPGDAPAVPHTQALNDAVAQFAAEPSRRTLAMALLDRSRHIVDDLGRMQAALAGIEVPQPLGARELGFFVSPEGWSPKALAPHLRLSSPIMRHAIRSAVALGVAYFLGLALPWASHPHWLVLSVAVVLRGNLDQTLSRRDARVAGTVLGCLVVLLLSLVHVPPLVSSAVFLVAAGTSHAFVNVRYLVTATAATVMALVQAHLADPAGGFGVGERLADTVLGALLAWGFSYVLPAWERRGLGRLVDRLQRGLRTLVKEALHWPVPGERDVALRLARREVYEAIGGIAASAQRTRAEPRSVQVPLYAMATLLTQSHVLLAQLAAVRTMLTRRGDRLDRAASEALLQQAQQEIDGLLAAPDVAPPAEEADAGAITATADLRLPPLGPNVPLLPWLERRLGLAKQRARQVAGAAAAVRAAARRR